MKKSLAMSIFLLALAVLTCCGVTFAYFNASNNPQDNFVEVGNFVFETDNTITGAGVYYFKAPTIINVPKITDGVKGEDGYDSAHEIFLSNGDDKYFDDYVVPITVNIENKSLTDMSVKITLSAKAGSSGSINPNYAFNGGFQSFVFNSEYTARLTEGEKKGMYGESIREICLAALDDTLVSDNIFTQTKLRLQRGREYMNKSIALSILPAVSVEGKYSKASYLAVAWLDWRAFSEVLQEDRPSGELILEVKVEASQFIS